jgi:hypothetical protein
LESVEKLGNLASATAPSTVRQISSGPNDATSDAVRAELSITPVSEDTEPPVLKESKGHPVTVYSADNHGFVTGKNANGNTAGFVSIKDASAPSSYKFSVGGTDQPVSLKLQADGSIWVLDASDNVVNFVQKPWAKDSAGKSLPTHYTVHGNVITQTVNLTGAVFPVVADPSYGCGFANCTIQFNKSETRDWATASAPTLGALIAGCTVAGGGVAGAACAAASGAMITSATLAVNHGECLELHFAGIPPAATWWPWNYSGGYCN